MGALAAVMRYGTLRATVLPVLLEGSARRPFDARVADALRGQSDAELAALSLLGQALQFAGPAQPEAFFSEASVSDERRVVPDAVRRPLLRLLAAKMGTPSASVALARAFQRLRLRPHPFDLPAMDSFVAAHAGKLGATAQQWANRERPEEIQLSYFEAEDLSAENWTQATLSRRVEFLRKRRAENPEAARILVESRWADEEAEARFRFLQELQPGLSVSDEPFLATLEKDRAPRVRTLAARLLSRLGAGGENLALRACLERIKEGKSGLLRKRKTLQLEVPADVNKTGVSRWIVQSFAEVSAGELASALGLTENELVEAAEKDQELSFAIAVIGSNEGRLDLVEAAVGAAPNAWEHMANAGFETLGARSEEDRQRWASILARRYGKELPLNFHPWAWMHAVVDTEFEPDLMSVLLRGGFVTTAMGREGESEAWAELFTAMCPKPTRQELRQKLGESGGSVGVAIALLEILDEMEKGGNHG